MKTNAIFRPQWMFLAVMVLFLPLLAGCQEEGLPDEGGAEVSLSRVPDNPGYASLPLIGTKWKLIGFVDGKRNRIRLAKPRSDDSYKLIFYEDGVFKGILLQIKCGRNIVLKSLWKKIKLTFLDLHQVLMPVKTLMDTYIQS